ncbi:hypothetical protein [uncultured Gammaproteobacteria bacterium]|nr:hypothetical protein [uncultured Gammaproteobacteria bacterium]
MPSPEEIEAMSKQMNTILDKEIANSKQINNVTTQRNLKS